MRHQDTIRRTKTHNCVGTEKFQGDAAGGSKLIEQTLLESEDRFLKIPINWRQTVRISMPTYSKNVQGVPIKVLN